MSELEEMVRVLLHGFPFYRDYVKSERMRYELAAKYYTTDELRHVLTGSFREEYPDIMFSDLDTMMLLNPLTEILTLETQNKVIQPVDEAPAHVQLIIPEGYRDYFKEKYHTISNFLGLLEVEEDCCFVSAEEARKLNERDFHPDFMADQKPSAPWTTPPTGVDETKISVAYTFYSDSKENAIEADRVPAIECTGWPTDAYEWKVRQPRNWPSADVVKKISSSGFMLVPKPSDLSGDIRREWRFSFSNPEAELLECLNEDQAKVYYLLRSLYARYLKEKLGGVLTSYHLKTVMFWMLEEEKPSVWSEESTLDLFFRVLNKLLRLLKDGFCPHYFIRDHNLFYKASKTALEGAANEITFVLRDPLVVFEKLVNPAFLGLIPRLSVLDLEVKRKMSEKILRLPTSAAFNSFNNPEAQRDLELRCLSEVLEGTATALKAFPNGVALIEVYITALLQGHQFAFTMGKSEAELAKIKMSSVQEDFMEMDTENVNQSLLVWMKLGKIAVDSVVEDTHNKLYSFYCKVSAFCRRENNPLSDEEKQTMAIFRAVCGTAGECLAMANFKAKDISYQRLYQRLCDVLGPAKNSAQTPCDITVSLFIFGSATCKMAKSFLDKQ
ncbi:hypothetical protein ACROYT_G029259 [Oculina patagonica]